MLGEARRSGEMVARLPRVGRPAGAGHEDVPEIDYRDVQLLSHLAHGVCVGFGGGSNSLKLLSGVGNRHGVLINRRRSDEDDARIVGRHARVSDDGFQILLVLIKRDVLLVQGAGQRCIVGPKEDELHV